jgi:ABC-type dipeptide/oligopeptide/nickel transport system ATPase subunit
MQKIKTITLNDFKFFNGNNSIELNRKNLLLYGENGSGKSSIYWAIYTFLQSTLKTNRSDIKKYFDSSKNENLVNRFAADDANSKIAIQFEDEDGSITEKCISKDTINTKTGNLVKEANQSSDLLNYKLLSRIYDFSNSEDLDLFELFERDILMFVKFRKELIKTDGTTGNSNASDWWKFLKAELKPYPNIHSDEYKRFESAVNNFNSELEFYINKIIEKANQFLQDYFKEDLAINFDYKKCLYNPKYSDLGIDKTGRDRRTIPPQIILKTKFKNRHFNTGEIELERPHTFFNEAKLTSIALAIRFAIIDEKLVSSAPKILVLDDLLISLDMSNRRTVLDIIFKLYSSFQIIFMTHDRSLYHYVQQQIRNRGLKENWKTIEMYQSSKDDIKQPAIFNISDKESLRKAKYHLLKHDYPACGIYLRRECEAILDRILPDTLKYSIIKSRFTSACETESTVLNDKLKLLKDFCKKESIDFIPFEDLIIHKSVILNTLAHNDITSPLYRSELEIALNTIEKLSNINRDKILIKHNKSIKLKLTKTDGNEFLLGLTTKDSLKLIEDGVNKRFSYFSKVVVSCEVDNGVKKVVNFEHESIYNVIDKYCTDLGIAKPELESILVDRSGSLISLMFSDIE